MSATAEAAKLKAAEMGDKATSAAKQGAASVAEAAAAAKAAAARALQGSPKKEQDLPLV